MKKNPVLQGRSFINHFKNTYFLMILVMIIQLLMFTLNVSAQNISVKGRVLKEDGQPVARASIIVKGSTTGTVGDENGNFEISVSPVGTLVISAVDFVTQEVKVSNQSSLSITLVSVEKSLGEVVVTGYGTQRKKEVTGSVVSIKGETLREIAAPNIYNQLQGRAAGVDIVSNGSSIGTGGEIRIRGNRSLGSSTNANNSQNSPLLVVDGIALVGGSINDINPDNIATMDILKDASATAIYGSRGSNGVILITTKRGRSGKSVVSYDGYYGVIQPIDTYRLFNGAEYAKFKEDARQGQPGYATNPNILNPYALNSTEQANLAEGVSTDWQDLLLTTGYRTNHNLSVSGGTDATQYYFGASYYQETGIIPSQKYNRGSFFVSMDHKISKRVKVGFNTNNTINIFNRVNSNAYGTATRIGPLYKPYNADGTINMQPAILQGVDNTQFNVLTTIENNEKIKAYTRRFRTISTFYGEVEIIKNLKYKLSVGLDWIQTLNQNYSGPNTTFNSNTTTAGSNISQSNDETWSYTIDNTLTYEKTLAQKHKIQLLALQEVVKNHNQSQGFSGQGVPADYIQDYNFLLANTINANAGSYSERGLISYMGRAVYSYDNRYVLNAMVRTDGASVLAPGNQWVTYPAISAAWNATNESFMSNINFLSNLKVRAGWGVTSNQTIAPYTTFGSLTSNFYNFGAGSTPNVNYVNGYVINTLANPGLSWEKTKGYNLGIDFGLFKNRITGTIEYYNVKTDDILLSKNLPRSTGANSVLVNAGKTSNHGMEFSVSSLNVKSNSGFTWRTDVNAFFSREKIEALQQGLTQDIGNGWFVGQPLTVIYDVKKIGIWQTSEATQAASYGVAPGDIKIADVDGPNHDGKPDGKIDANDRQIIGNFQPDLIAGFTSYMQFKNFDLSIVLFGRFGQSVVVTYLSADGGANGYPFFLNSRVNQLKVDYWTPTNPTNAFPQPDASKDNLNFTSTLTYRDGSFIKIRTIDLGYNIPLKAIQRAGISSFRVYVSAQNPLILWAPLVRDNLGIDPEGNGNGGAVGSNAGGTPVTARTITVGMGVPPSRQFIFGVNVKF